MNPSASGSRTSSTKHILTQKVEGVLGAEPGAHQDLQPARITVEATVEVPRVRRPLHRWSCDTGPAAQPGARPGETVLLEAAQATLLDVDHGTYPFVTSSSATAGVACTGRGIRRPGSTGSSGSSRPTRPGWGGPFPTELNDDAGEHLRKVGAEFGTTDRPPAPLRVVRRGHRPLRRPGHRGHRLRAHQARRAHRLDGCRSASRTTSTAPATTRCRSTRRLPPRRADLRVPRRLVGVDISAACTFDDLPANARAYVGAVEAMSGARISRDRRRPSRDATVVRHDLLARPGTC